MFKNIQKTISQLFVNRRNDSWQNPFTNLGMPISKTASTNYKFSTRLDRKTLDDIYCSNGIGKRIVNLVVDDAIRSFIEADKLLLKELARLHVKQNILEAGYKGRLYGGAMIIAFIEDGQGFDKPLNFKRIDKLMSLKVINRYQVSWSDDDICTNFSSEYFGKPEVFTIKPDLNHYNENDSNIRMHRSRCFIFGGDMSTNSMENWDEPILQASYEALRNFGIVSNSSVEIVHDFIQVIMKMKGLSDMLSNGHESDIRKRIDLIDRTRSTSNIILLDGDEEGNEAYEKKSSSIAGLPELWDKMAENICAVSGIPKTKLFGSSPAGLNSTGKGDLQQWYDVVRSYRSDQVEPCINWLIEILKHQQSWKNKPSSFEWEFPSLTAPSELEWADIKKKHAEIDWGYIDRGAIDPVEAWQERFGKGDFHININLSKPTIDKDIEIAEENLDLFEKKETFLEPKTNVKHEDIEKIY